MKENVVKLLQELIKIDSQNPGGNEREIILFIQDYLKRLGVSCQIYEFKKDRLNLVCKIKSKNSLKSILLTPHVDTVPVTGQWEFPPFSGKIYKGRVYGRGATDCKSNAAVSLALIKKLTEDKIFFKNMDLIFAFCADEETGSDYGIKPLAKYFKKVNYGIVLDADEFDIIVAQKGMLHLRVELWGKEAHGAFPWRGINAVEKGVKILNEIISRGFSYKPHPLLKGPTLNVGRFTGGDKVNIVAGYAFFELDIRYIPSMDKERIIQDIEKIVKKQKIKYKIETLTHQEPIEIKKDIFLIKNLRDVLKEQGIKAKCRASFGATVINFLTDKGIDSFAFGFGTKEQAHTKNEYVEIDNLYKGVRVLEAYLKRIDVLLR